MLRAKGLFSSYKFKIPRPLCLRLPTEQWPRFIAGPAGTFEVLERFLCGGAFPCCADHAQDHVSTESLFLTRDGADLAALDGATVAVPRVW